MQHAAISSRITSSGRDADTLGLAVGRVEEGDLELRDLGEERGHAFLALGRELETVAVGLVAQSGNDGFELGERMEGDPFGQVEAFRRGAFMKRGDFAPSNFPTVRTTKRRRRTWAIVGNGIASRHPTRAASVRILL